MSVIVRDKGIIPLPRPDGKVRGTVDPASGNVLLLYADAPAHLACYWWQPTGWGAPIHWGELNIMDFDVLIHDGHIKMVVRTWGGDASPEGRAVILDLGELPA